MTFPLKHPPAAWPLWLAALTGLASAPGFTASAQQSISIPAGVPLHVTVTHSAPLRVGAKVQGVLTEPIWVYDRAVLRQGAVVEGVVTSLVQAPGSERLHAKLDGDLTPLRMPVVDFTRVRSGDTEVGLHATGEERATQLVRFVAGPKKTVRSQLSAVVRDKVESVREVVAAPNLGDRALRFVYNQLPYHPQRIWRGTQFVADTDAATLVSVADPMPPAHLEQVSLVEELPQDAVVKARLITSLNSETAKHGDPVTARLTEPLFDGQRNLVLPEGTELEGEVLRAKASRSFSRNGQLQFTFRGVRQPGRDLEKMRGTVTGADGDKSENLTLDSEGDVKAEPDKNRFLAPLLLGVLAAHGQDDDGGAASQGVAANGLGIVTRVVAITAASPGFATGIGAYGFAKSIYYRFIARGHAVAFPKDTQLEVQLSSR